MSEWADIDGVGDLHARRQEHWYARLMTLADGVFAIAITFLAADIGQPANWAGDWPSLWSHLSPQLDAYLMSFLVISVFWLAHRRFMAVILRVDAPLTVLTLVVLGLVALLPPATRLISRYGELGVARLVYGVLLVAIGASLAAMWAYAALIARIVADAVSVRVRWFVLILIFLTPPFFMGLTLFVPPGHGSWVPAILTVLFLVGWRLRLWVGRRLGGERHTA
jgi:uncharacterized membrane protein